MLAFVALGVLGTWLLLTTAEVHEPLHRWLHGGTIPDDDDCAVVLLATGKVDVAVVTATAAPVAVAIIALVQTYVLPLVPRLALPMGRGPPRFPASRLV
jgi:hypothetical protein